MGTVRLRDQDSDCPEMFANHRAFPELLELIETLLARKPVSEWQLDDVQTLVTCWLGQMRLVSDATDFLQLPRRPLKKRSVGKLEELVQPHGEFEAVLLDLFLASRQRRQIFAYLAVQEGLNWEATAGRSPGAAGQAWKLLGQLGKVPLLAIRFQVLRLRIRFKWDPFSVLRKSYSYLLLHQRKRTRQFAWLLLWYWRILFRLQARVYAFFLRRTIRTGLAAFQRNTWEPSTHHHGVARLFSNVITFFFPQSRRLPAQRRQQYSEMILPELRARITAIVQSIPVDSVDDDGYAKWLKIVFGVIVNTTHFSDRYGFTIPEMDRCLHLGVAWGATYPLIDNILDSQQTPQHHRESLKQALFTLFDGKDLPAIAQDNCSPATVAARQVEAAIANSFTDDRPELLAVLRLLLLSHLEDSEQTLSAVRPDQLTHDEIQKLWANSIVKAALIRLATHCLCGVRLSAGRIADLFVGGLLNQFGDDLWDTLSDRQADRLTPFTLYLLHNLGPDPVDFFLRYLATLATGVPRDRQLALAIGFLETTRCCLQTMPQKATTESQLLLTRLADTLARYGGHWTVETLHRVPHVDPDSLLFRLMNYLIRTDYPKK